MSVTDAKKKKKKKKERKKGAVSMVKMRAAYYTQLKFS